MTILFVVSACLALIAVLGIGAILFGVATHQIEV